MAEEVLSFGLRSDGRRPTELRDIEFSLNLVESCDGSAFYRIGLTKVMALIDGPKQAKDKSEGVIRCFYRSAHFSSSGERRKLTKGDKRSSEFESTIQGIYEDVIRMEEISHSDIDIHVVVLQDDGSVESAAINAISLALVNAGIPMKDLVISCSAGRFNHTSLLDLTYTESSSFKVISEYTVAIVPRTEGIIYINYDDIGGHRLTPDLVQDITALSIEGCRQIYFKLKEYLKDIFSS